MYSEIVTQNSDFHSTPRCCLLVVSAITSQVFRCYVSWGVLLISCGNKRLLPGLSDEDHLEHLTLNINLGWYPDSLYFSYSFSCLTP